MTRTVPQSCVDQNAKGSSIKQNFGDSYDEVIKHTDVLYITRVQKERFESAAEYEACKGLYVLDAADMAHAKQDMIVMHPLPRVDEIDLEVDKDPRAVYFKQPGYGLSTRMALLALSMDAVSPKRT